MLGVVEHPPEEVRRKPERDARPTAIAAWLHEHPARLVPAADHERHRGLVLAIAEHDVCGGALWPRRAAQAHQADAGCAAVEYREGAQLAVRGRGDEATIELIAVALEAQRLVSAGFSVRW